ncbi:MAG: hypothetical protein ACREMQ_16830 [Longimicrobiales bacterium]
MRSPLSPSRIRKSWTSVLLVLTAVTLATCDRAPTALPADLEPAMAPGGNPKLEPLVLTVTKGGSPALGAGLWLYDANGLVKDNQGNRKVFSDGDDGTTDGVITALVPVGDYGAVLKSLPTGAQLFEGIAPASPPIFDPVDLANAFAPVARAMSGWVCATPGTIQDTRTDLPIEHKSPSTEESVEVTDCDFIELNVPLPGAANFDVVYLVIDAINSGIGEDTSKPDGWLPGVPGFITKALNGAATVVCPVGSSFGLELLQSIPIPNSNKSYNKVASFLGECDPDTQLNLAPQVARCEQVRDPAIGEFNNPVFASAIFSYHFTRSAPPLWPKTPDLTTSSADVAVKVAGEYVVIFRTDLLSGRLQTERTIVIASNGTATVTGKTRNNGKGNNQILELSFLPTVPGAPAGVITAVLANIPAHVANSFFVKGPGGAGLPLSARPEDFAAYYLMPKPADPQRCTLALSNDPGWWVREP